MSSNPSPPAATSASKASSQRQRVLACVLCQQRKIRCSRTFPCTNCVKSRQQCVPATLLQRRRKRRFPERELLDRLRKYEELMKRNGITFEPMHEEIGQESIRPSEEEEHRNQEGESGEMEVSTPATTVRSEAGFQAKNVWHAMSHGFREDDSDSGNDDIREKVVKSAWNQAAENEDHLLFGSKRTTVDLSALHPNTVQIFRLWQVYSDNVNPLLKVTHTPTLQGRIIEAASDLTSISPTTEALMFSIYCTAVMSLTDEDCQTMFASSKEDLSTRFQFGCQQALYNSAFLRSDDRDCLTALYLYLVSVRSSTVPQSLSSMLGVAIRTAQRLGIHNERNLSKYTILEAEMCRRLWWSLVIFDARTCELASLNDSTLNPTWDCKIPLNVNDYDLRPEMNTPPATYGTPTEALFIVIRSKINNFVRHSEFHLDFTNPALKPAVQNSESGPVRLRDDLTKLEKEIEDEDFKFCDPEHSLHFITMWMARAQLAKCRLMEHHARHSTSAVRQTEADRDAATGHALNLLVADTMIMKSSLTKRFRWLNKAYFPFPAYFQITQDLRARSVAEKSKYAWEIMSDNCEAWTSFQFHDGSNHFFQFLAKLILEAWTACEKASEQLGEALPVPRIVSAIRNTVPQTVQPAADADLTANLATEIFPIPMSMPDSYDPPNMAHTAEMPDSFSMMGSGLYPSISGQGPFNAYRNPFDWTLFGGRPGWGGF